MLDLATFPKKEALELMAQATGLRPGQPGFHEEFSKRFCPHADPSLGYVETDFFAGQPAERRSHLETIERFDVV